jgi:hypothetical protein
MIALRFFFFFFSLLLSDSLSLFLNPLFTCVVVKRMPLLCGLLATYYRCNLRTFFPKFQNFKFCKFKFEFQFTHYAGMAILQSQN